MSFSGLSINWIAMGEQIMIQDFMEFFSTQIEWSMLPFSIPLVICLVYWILMIIGLLDLEIVDTLFGLGDGAADGLADSAADAVADGSADSLEGVGESVGFLAAFMGFLNFGQAPATIIASIFSFSMWFFANSARIVFSTDKVASTGALFGMFAATFVVSFIISSIFTHFAGKPFKKLMAICTYRGGVHLIGKVCEVRSSKVTVKSGQAELTLEGGSPLILHVICDHENELKKGNKAVIVDYEKKKDQYVVEPMF